ncbi:hypothetical protein F5Y10DRAFT_199661 [Nemania abortiva]|nr:hypothetical protein F5Y10DRAFT_199661 [Nemania abortiva]
MNAYERAFNLAKAIIGKMRKLHYGPQNFASLDVICSDLDIHSGKSSDEAAVFMRPLSKEELHAFVPKEQPLKLYPSISGTPLRMRYLDARCLSSSLYTYLHLSLDHLDGNDFEDRFNPDPRVLVKEARWYGRGMEWNEGERLAVLKTKVYFAVDELYEKLDENDTCMLAGLPHITPMLSDNAEMLEDHLSFAELWCILCCTIARIRSRDGYRRYRFMPVTVMSFSGRSARVVHGYVDEPAGKLRVFKSKIIHFKVDNYRSGMDTLASWTLGHAIEPPLWEPSD